MAASVCAVIICAMPIAVHAQPEYEIDGVEVLQQQVTQDTTITVENGSAEEYVSQPPQQSGEAQETPDIIENENGRFYVLDRGRTAFETISKEYILYCGLDMVRSNYPPDIPLPQGIELYIDIPTGINAQLYKDGELLDVQQRYTVTEAGRYVLQLENVSGKKETYDYIILADTVNYFNKITMPEGFRLNYIEHNGKKLTLQYNNYADLIVDGSYRIGWICEGADLYYHTDFVLDTEPPVLALPQVVNGESNEPVTITDLEDGAVIKCTVDEIVSYIDNPNTVLDEPGSYELVVSDAAGNVSVYNFRINLYVDVYGYIAIIMLIALVSGLVIYSKWLKKHMRVG